MDQNPLVTEQIESAAKFLEEFEKKIHVLAAFWMKQNEGDLWYLYLVPEGLTSDNVKETYGVVVSVAHQMTEYYFNPFRVKIIKTSDPLAESVLAFLQNHPVKHAVRFRDEFFGRIAPEEVYLYPASVPVS